MSIQGSVNEAIRQTAILNSVIDPLDIKEETRYNKEKESQANYMKSLTEAIKNGSEEDAGALKKEAARVTAEQGELLRHGIKRGYEDPNKLMEQLKMESLTQSMMKKSEERVKDRQTEVRTNEAKKEQMSQVIRKAPTGTKGKLSNSQINSIKNDMRWS